MPLYGADLLEIVEPLPGAPWEIHAGPGDS